MHRVLALPVLLGVLASAAYAQQQPIIDRAGQGTPTSPAPASGEAALPSRGTDEDAGVQRVAQPRKLPFRVSATFDEQLYVTNNVFLAADGAPDAGEDATILASTFLLRVEGLPSAVGRGLLVPSLGFGYQRYLHGLSTNDPGIEALDFDSFSLPLSVAYRFGHGWEASAGFTIGSLYSVRGDPSYELLYRTHTGTLALRKVTEVAKNTLFVAGGSLGYSDTWTSLRNVPSALAYRDDRNDKAEYSLDAALYRFAGAWTFSPFVHLTYTDYVHWQEGGHEDFDRADLSFGAGVSASFAFKTWGSVRAFVGYDLRGSTLDGSLSGSTVEPDYTYDAGTLGAGLTLSLRY